MFVSVSYGEIMLSFKQDRQSKLLHVLHSGQISHFIFSFVFLWSTQQPVSYTWQGVKRRLNHLQKWQFYFQFTFYKITWLKLLSEIISAVVIHSFFLIIFFFFWGGVDNSLNHFDAMVGHGHPFWVTSSQFPRQSRKGHTNVIESVDSP